MTTLQKIEVRLSEVRQRLNELAVVEGITPEQTTEVETLANESKGLEVQFRAATIAEVETRERSTIDGSDAELRRLADRANAGNIFLAAVEKRATTGSEKEIQDHFKIPAHSIPLSMLEERAVATIPADVSHSPVATGQGAILQPVFSTGDSAFLSVSQPRVAPGQASFPVLSSRPTVRGPFTGNDTAAETTATFTAALLEPNRIQAGFSYRRTDSAKFPSMDQSLRQALSSGLSEKLDAQLVTQVLADVTQTDAGSADTYATYLSRFVFALVDGRYVTGEDGLRLLIGTTTLSDMSSLYRSANAGEMSAIEKLRSITGGVRVSPHIPAAASNKQPVLVRRGTRPDAVVPVWEGVQLVVDEITGVGVGSIKITAILLAAWKVVRTGGFQVIEAQHS